jgi:recombination protein RecT
MSTEVAKRPTLTLREQLQSEGMKKHLEMALPKHLTSDRMIRVALTAMTKMPKLADCDQASFFQALFQCSQWGLEPDGRRAHLIPFENKRKGIVECQLIFDYKGLAELAYRSGLVKTIHAQEVREGDLFDFDMGQVKRHVPHAFRRDPGKPSQAGNVYAYYCVVEMAGDARKCEVMSLSEVNAIRDKSQGYQSFKKGWAKTSVWEDYPHEMGKKTVFKRASKWLPLSPEFMSAVSHDDADYEERAEIVHSTIDSIGNLLAADDALPAIEGSVVEQPEPQDSSGPSLFDQARDAVESAADPMACKAAFDAWVSQLDERDQDDLNTVYQAQLKTYPTSAKAPKGKQGGLPMNP